MVTAVRRADVRLSMTEEEFEAWCDEDTRAELLEGEVTEMSPESVRDERVRRFLDGLLTLWVARHNLGEIFGPNLQMRLGPALRRVPDLFFLKQENLHRLRDTYLEGPADWVLEIVSPDSVERDVRDKFHDYQKAGVNEYWLVFPLERRLSAYSLSQEGLYVAIPPQEGWVCSHVVPGLRLRPEWLWQEPRPTLDEVLAAWEQASPQVAG